MENNGATNYTEKASCCLAIGAGQIELSTCFVRPRVGPCIIKARTDMRVFMGLYFNPCWSNAFMLVAGRLVWVYEIMNYPQNMKPCDNDNQDDLEYFVHA